MKLVGDIEIKLCPECGGKGKIPQPDCYTVRTSVHYSGGGHGAIRTPDHGKPIPCPTCKGRKTVTV